MDNKKDIKKVYMTETLSKYIEKLVELKLDEDIRSIGKLLLQYINQFKEAKEKGIPTLSLIREYHKALDTLIAMDLSEQNGHATPSCRKGCSFCCKIRVDCTREEVLYILAYLKYSKTELSQEQLDRAEAQKGLTTNQWNISQHSSCVFLKNNECSIYGVRPAACRTYHVVSEPQLCDATQYSNRVRIMATPHSQILRSAFLTVFGNETMSTLLLDELNKTNNGKAMSHMPVLEGEHRQTDTNGL